MNKKQFLAELNHYLTFLTASERAEVIADYAAKFDPVPEDGEAAFILSLGTPTMIAIDLKRKKESGKYVVSPAKEDIENPEPTVIESPVVEAEAEQDESKEAQPEPENPDEPKEVRKGNVFAIIGAALLSLLASALCLVIACVGVYFVVIMGNLLLTGLQSLYSASNALLLFGGGLAAGALGIVIIWFAIWSAISLVARLFRATSRASQR